MKQTTTLLSFLFLPFSAFTQTDTSIYSNLEYVKYYAVSTSRSGSGANAKYRVEGELVSQAEYEKFQSTWEAMANCCPCVLQSFNRYDELVSEAVACTDCLVGDYKGFYPNGSIKITGQYKENPTGDWNNISARGYCNVHVGEWNYYDQNGDIKYTELWEDGMFIDQFPESGQTEIWRVDLLLDGLPVDTQKVAISDLNRLEVLPQYKNSNESQDLHLKIRATAGFRIGANRNLPIGDMHLLDIEELLEEMDHPSVADISLSITVWDGEEWLWPFHLKIKE